MISVFRSLCIFIVIGTFALADEDTYSLMPEMELVTDNIDFEDDLQLKSMIKAISRQEKNFQTADMSVKMNFGKRVIQRKHLKESLAVFKGLVYKTINCLKVDAAKNCYKELSFAINEKFEKYKPIPLNWEKGYAAKKTLFTAYYSPDMEGSKTKTEVYKNPIYAMPTEPKLKSLTSDQINYEDGLKGKGLELFYVKESLYDVWLLHVEGGGRVKVKQADGSFQSFYLSYAGSNKKSFAMLFKYMREKGMLGENATSIEAQREYFLSHPEHQREILASCPSYVWFKVTKTEPLGVRNIPLTENRSLATDYRRMQEYGIINYIQYEKDESLKLNRFFLNQDTGGAIKGNARTDLYFGFGKNAERAANKVYGLGDQIFLILK